jgi:hypothetical protein
MKYIITEEQLSNASKSLIELINKEGLITASKFASGYDNLKTLLGDYEISKDIKIAAIRDYIYTKTDGGVHLGELDEDPIPYHEDSKGFHQIEYLGYSNAIINVWGGHEGSRDMGEYSVRYDELTSKSLDDILEMIINHS